MTTRECIIKGNFWFGELEKAGEGAIATALVSDIFDKIDAQVCENCKHLKRISSVTQCDILDIQVFVNFGCTEWEKK